MPSSDSVTVGRININLIMNRGSQPTMKLAPEKATCKRKLFISLFLWIGVSVLVIGYWQKPLTSIIRMMSVHVKTHHKPITPTMYESTTGDDGCQGFNNDPYHPSIVKYFKTNPPISCKGNLPNLIYFDKDQSVLKVNRDKAKSLKVKVDYCKYVSLHRVKGDDYKGRHSAWSKTFTQSITIPDTVEYIVGDCFYNKRLVAHGYVSILRINATKEALYKKRYDEHVATNLPEETLSVLLFGIDGTSKQNFVRQMPRTKKFLLDEMGGIGMYKLNKVGLNTFPNVMALLGGVSEAEVRTNHTDKDPFDHLDHMFLWGEAQRKGYRTSMNLDRIKITSFHFLKKGWAYPKFDWYNRAVVLQAETDKVARKANGYCIGDQTEMRVLYDHWLQMTAAYNNTKTTPYFAYSFFAHLTHDYINYLSHADEHYYQLFKMFQAQNSLNNTLAVFFSDHGNRYGEYRSTLRGMQEDNNPFMVFMFPPWFVKKYDNLMANFRKNQHRVMTNFDVHATLKDILNFHPSDILQRTVQKTRGISLFNELPAKRTCEESGIPLKYCNCRTITSMQVASGQAVNASKVLLTNVIGRTKAFRKDCAALTLKTTNAVLNIVTTSTTHDHFQVTITTSPGGALYEATLSAKKKGAAEMRVVGDIARVNMYRGQADCVQDARVRPFCYCNNLLS